MELGQPNPITQRLTRDIDPKRQNIQVAAAITAAAIIGAGASGWFVVPVINTPSNPPNLAGLFIILALMIALPIVSGVASAILTYKEVHVENFKLIQITPLADQEIIDGFVEGIKVRLRPVLLASESLALATGATPFILFLNSLLGSESPNLATGAIPFVLFLNSVFSDAWGEDAAAAIRTPLRFITVTIALLIVLVYLWVATRQTYHMATLAGIYTAVRFRGGNIAIISVCVAGAVMLTQFFVSPLTVFGAAIALLDGPGADNSPLVPALIYLLIPIVSRWVIRYVFEKYLKHTRLSAG